MAEYHTHHALLGFPHRVSEDYTPHGSNHSTAHQFRGFSNNDVHRFAYPSNREDFLQVDQSIQHLWEEVAYANNCVVGPGPPIYPVNQHRGGGHIPAWSPRFPVDLDRIASLRWSQGYQRTRWALEDHSSVEAERASRHILPVDLGWSWWCGEDPTSPEWIYLNAEQIAGASQRVLYTYGNHSYIPKRVWVSSAEQALNEIGHFRTQKDIAFAAGVITGLGEIPGREVAEEGKQSASRIVAIICRRFFLLLLTYNPTTELGLKLDINLYRRTILSLLECREKVAVSLEAYFGQTDPEPLSTDPPPLEPSHFQIVSNSRWDCLRGKTYTVHPENPRDVPSVHPERAFADKVLEHQGNTVNRVKGSPFTWSDYKDERYGPKFRWWEPRGY